MSKRQEEVSELGNSLGLIPRFRFPEFLDKDEWLFKELSEIAERIVNKVGVQKLVTLSISAGTGFVSQKEKFSRDISGEQYKNYIVIEKGDFAYNKGNSKKFPEGCIYKLDNFMKAAVPNSFICFRFNNEVIPDFYLGYFDNNFHGNQLKKFITSGARMDGLLNINASDFFTIKLPTPKDKNEQQKVADTLSSLDDLLAAHNEKLEALKQYKKGLMQVLFPAAGESVPRLRFKEFLEEWVEKKLGDLFKVCNGKDYKHLSSGNIPVYGSGGYMHSVNDYIYEGESVCIGRKGTINKPMFLVGKFWTVDTLFYTNDFNNCLPKFIYLLFVNINWLKHNEAGGVPSLSKTVIVKILTKVPTVKEQQKIASTLYSLDELITTQIQKIEALKTHKKGLMQGIFPTQL